MLIPQLFVGVGGSGGKTLRYLYRELERRLRAAGWTGEMPAAWGFLHIDIPDRPDGFEADVPPGTLIGASEYLGLARRDVDYDYYFQTVTRHPSLERATAGWVPPVEGSFEQIWLGAKQVRALGRVVTISELDEVGERLRRRSTELRQPDAGRELDDLATLLGTTASDELQVIVIGSLGGGAGSGMLLDISEFIRWEIDEHPISVLFTPEIFEHITPMDRRRGIAPNSLACVSELISAFEHTGPLSESERSQFAGAGITNQVEGRRGGLQNLIVGSSNDHLTLKDSYAAYRATARALAAFVSNPTIRDQFSSYLTANLTAAIARTDNLLVSNSPTPKAPFSAFGFATVGLGRSLYLEYAAQRLAAAALDRIRRGHLADVAPGTLVDEDRKISAIVEQRKLSFIEACGLSETRPNANQVMDALRDTTQVETALKRLRELVETSFAEKFAEGRPDDMRKSLVGQWTDEVKQFNKEREDDVRRRAATWVLDVQRKILHATAAAIGDFGLPVASSLVREAAMEAEAAAADFRRSGVARTGKVRSAVMEASEFFSNLGKKIIGGNHEAVSNSVSKLATSADQREEQRVEVLAADLLESLGRGLFAPLKTALANAAIELDELMASRSSTAPATVVAGWPRESRPSVPSTLLPSANDVLLIETDEFPDEFEHILEAAFESSPSAALSQAVREVISGIWPRSDSVSAGMEQDLVVSDPIWVPEVAALSDALGTATQAQMRFGFHPVSVILNRSRYWMSHRRGPVADYARESLGQHLRSDHPSHVRRAETFTSRFRQALELAEPMCRLDPTAYNESYSQGDPDDRSYIIGKVPIGRDHEAADDVANALEERTSEDPTSWFDPASVAQEIEIASFLSSAIGPVPLISLTAPILREWERVHQDKANRLEFWRHRRSRPLQSFVPLSPQRLTAFLRGWFTGLVLDHIPPYAKYWEEEALSVWTDDGRLPFPRYLLGPDVTTEMEVPAALLETLPLAMFRFTSGDRTELAAYERVIELGTSDDPVTADDRYLHIPSVLRRWIDAGETDEGAPVPNAGLASTAAASVDERRNTIHASLSHWITELERIKKLEHDEAVREGVSRIWELADESRLALVEIRDRLGQTTSVQPKSSTDLRTPDPTR